MTFYFIVQSILYNYADDNTLSFIQILYQIFRKIDQYLLLNVYYKSFTKNK